MRRSLRQAQQRGSEAPDASPNRHSKIDGSEVLTLSHNSKAPRKRPARAPQTRRDASHDEDDDYQSSDQKPSNKKRKIVSRSNNGQKLGNPQLFQRLFSIDGVASDMPPCQPPQRIHNIDYHRPLLLDSRKGRAELLEWFDNVSSRRSMPWRKPWFDPRMDADGPALRERLERRAYEVWISEIMLQQTRVAAVIDYWNRWMEKWPTIHELATASSDDVLAAWRGLGYYSRATRIHDAAKLVCEDSAMKGLLPSSVDTLVAKVPGVGRYTAGAISAIVFGKAAPMVDGNVLRVLSRQLGLLGDVKRDKPVIDLLWAAADSLVKAVAETSCEEYSCGEKISSATEEQTSDRPGRWGQALMELGSTVCTPKPNCEACPISTSCRAYGEGLQLASTRGLAPKNMKTDLNTKPLPDIEDSCDFCKPFEEVALDGDEGDAETVSLSKKTSASRSKARPRIRRQATLSAFFAQSSESKETTNSMPDELTPVGVATIVDHARKFPVKVVKKALREQETLVCAVRRSDGCYIIHRRPQKGLLAGLWEFPSWIVPEDYENIATAYQRAAELHASAVLDPTLKLKCLTHPKLKYVGKLGSVPWLFSHLKLTMHVFLFEIKSSKNEYDALPSTDDRWSGSIEAESMSTGMRKCWDLVREVNGD